MRRWTTVLLFSCSLAACAVRPAVDAADGRLRGPDFSVAEPTPARPLSFIAYGDMRFTSPEERTAAVPNVRLALVRQIATEEPAALLLTGDVPWHGGTNADYDVYRAETRPWRERGIPVFPALGNHEFSGCDEAQCLENWWNAFPELRDKRWYAVSIGSQVRAIALDTDAPLGAGSPQQAWLRGVLGTLPASVRYVVLYMHHPPVSDVASGALANHNPRENEQALAAYVEELAATSKARLVVIAGHIHNYERLEERGVVYLVSGGGGARPYPVERGPQDLYLGTEEPNFHYIRFTVAADRLHGEMIRVEDPSAVAPHQFVVRDVFDVSAR